MAAKAQAKRSTIRRTTRRRKSAETAETAETVEAAGVVLGDAGNLPDCSMDLEQSDPDVELVKTTLRSIMQDPTAPAAAKAQAARTLAELKGVLGRNAKPPAATRKPIAEMTRAEMEAELAALEAE